MALLFFDGFDHYTDNDITKKWSHLVSGAIVAGAGRLGTAGVNNPVSFFTAVPASGSTAIVGFAVKPTLGGGNSTMTIYLDGITANSPGPQIELSTLADGAIRIRRGGLTEIARSAPGVLTAGVHQYIELKTLIDNTVGTVEVHVDGVSVIAASGLDTQQASQATWNIIFIGGDGDGWDDIYACDGTGSAPWNDFLGDVHVDTLFPLTDAEVPGTHLQFTPSTGTDHGALVDEAAPGTGAGGTDDYNKASTAVLRETYRFDPPTVGVEIFGIQTLAFAAKTETQMVQCATLLIADGVMHQGETKYPSVNLPASGITLGYDYLREIFETNPNTGAQWSIATLAAIEAGLVRLV